MSYHPVSKTQSTMRRCGKRSRVDLWASLRLDKAGAINESEDEYFLLYSESEDEYLLFCDELKGLSPGGTRINMCTDWSVWLWCVVLHLIARHLWFGVWVFTLWFYVRACFFSVFINNLKFLCRSELDVRALLLVCRPPRLLCLCFGVDRPLRHPVRDRSEEQFNSIIL